MKPNGKTEKPRDEEIKVEVSERASATDSSSVIVGWAADAHEISDAIDSAENFVAYKDALKQSTALGNYFNRSIQAIGRQKKRYTLDDVIEIAIGKATVKTNIKEIMSHLVELASNQHPPFHGYAENEFKYEDDDPEVVCLSRKAMRERLSRRIKKLSQ